MKSKNDKTLLVSAGEVSGDLLGSTILEELNKLISLNVYGFGGDKMQAAGAHIIHDVDEMATVGFWEALKNLRKLKRFALDLYQKIDQQPPDLAMIIDFPGFNLHIAEKMHEQGIPVIMIVSPQVWAWRYRRVYRMQRILKSIFCLYDFEVDLYREVGLPAHFIGHPLVKKVKQSKSNFQNNGNPLEDELKKSSIPPHSGRRYMTLLPGSRRSEISKLLPFLVELATKIHQTHPETGFIIPAANQRIRNIIEEYQLPEYIHLTEKGTHAALAISDTAVAVSGTVTLECALFEIPILIIYATSALSFFIGKRVSKVPYVGMVNVIAKDFIIKEFLQKEITLKNVLPEALKLMDDQNYRQEIKDKLNAVAARLGDGNSAFNAARIIHQNYLKV